MATLPAQLTARAEDALEFWPQLSAMRPRPLHVGHINDTYLLHPAEGSNAPPKFVLQRINPFVFPDPEAVMDNLAMALRHEGGRLLIAPIPSAEGSPLARDDSGDCWRLFPYVPSRNFQNLPDELLQAAGAAYGTFLAVFADFDQPLQPAIAGFNDLPSYLTRYDSLPKMAEAAAECDAVEALREEFRPGTVRGTIHGDCKINNLLFHPARPEVVAVIDLDTVMRGDPAWDFGDLVRSAFAGGEEAAAPGEWSLPRFERLCAGFAGAFRGIDDVHRYAAAPSYMSFMLAVRFLSDHLQGDVYFKVAKPGDNLLRARSQLRLARRFRQAAPAFAAVLERAIAVPAQGAPS